MRDENDYAAMGVPELRRELVSTTQQLATWTFSLATQRAATLRPFFEAYDGSQARSVAERVKEAEMATVTDQQQIREAEGHVAFHTAIRDCILALLEHPETALVTDGAGIPHAVPVPPLQAVDTGTYPPNLVR